MGEREGLCRDCLEAIPPDRLPDRGAGRPSGRTGRCPACGSPRTLAHPELDALTIAHVDCDAFYAAVEKRDDPSLATRPVIVGGGRRGVVTTACYVARLSGVRSAMPMFKALKLCPDAVVLRPDFPRYVAVGREVRARMEALTPLVQPVSIDEAFLDLSGTERLHGGSPARTLARFAADIERDLGITVSVGLSHNRFLAKFASDLDKPRGFVVLGRADAEARLAPAPVGRLPGVGPVAEATLAAAGYRLVGDLQAAPLDLLLRRFGAEGARLKRLAHGVDPRPVDPRAARRSVSAEETFDDDVGDRQLLTAMLRHLAEKVSVRLKALDLAGSGLTLKLKTPDFRILTRSARTAEPTQMAHRIFAATAPLLAREATGARFRLIGVGVSDLVPAALADPPDLVDPAADRASRAERAVDRLRARFGDEAIVLGLTLAAPRRRPRPPSG